jgi:hypothetical protein
MSDKKKYLVRAAESRKRHGYIWRLSAMWRYGQWALVALSDEAAEVLKADSDIEIKEYKGQKVEYTTEITTATNPPEKDMVEILFNTDYEEAEAESKPEPKKKTTTRKSKSKTQTSKKE